jgi:hypothetical protein
MVKVNVSFLCGDYITLDRPNIEQAEKARKEIFKKILIGKTFEFEDTDGTKYIINPKAVSYVEIANKRIQEELSQTKLGSGIMKTLKELEFTKDDRAFCSEYGCDLSYENFIKDLRQEAIKWCKEIRREADEIIMSPARYIGQGKKITYLTGQIMILKHFFNLTDEETKNVKNN